MAFNHKTTLSAVLMLVAIVAATLRSLCALAADESLDPALLAARDTVYKHYGVSIANPGDYPVTLYSNDQVPLPATMTGLYTIYWVDDDTILYTENWPQAPLTSEELHMPGIQPVITVNLKTFHKQEVGKAGGGISDLCYDYETQNIAFLQTPAVVPRNGVRTWQYGTLGQPLRTYSYPASTKHKDTPYVNPFDCSFQEHQPKWTRNTGGQFLRTSNGSLYVAAKPDANAFSTSPTTYAFVKPDGTEKRFVMGTSAVPGFHYDYFSKLYWQSETLPDRKLKVWRFDPTFTPITEETYRDGPWPFRSSTSILKYSAKPGFIIPGHISARDNAGQLLIYYPLYLLSIDGRIIDIMHGFIDGIRISPNGCKAVFVLNDTPHAQPIFTADLHIGVLNLCGTH